MCCAAGWAAAGDAHSTSASQNAGTSCDVGLEDRGIFSDLDQSISLPLFAGARPENTSIAVNKRARTLSVLVDGTPVKTYPAALGFSPEGDKKREGDGRTPEGVYTIVEMSDRNLPKKYGARSMLLSYPNKKDAARGLRTGLISKEKAAAIAARIQKGKTPPQDTPLGSSIRIHGGGVGKDWTLGCIAMRDEDIEELFEVVRPGTRVRIAPDVPAGLRDTDRDGIPDPVDILLGALKADANDAAYDDGYYSISKKLGDVPRKRGCCSDVVVRALRNAGIDLQSALQRDRQKAPGAYPGMRRPNPNIDHRRVRNLVRYFKRHFKEIPLSSRRYMPGDILLFDTLPKSGPDHIGVVGVDVSGTDAPPIINNWTYGAVTDPMPLTTFVPVTHHFRAPR